MKYELTDNTKDYLGITLYQIKALKDFADVKAGDLGGWVASEKNLSQEGSCWVYGNAEVFGNAKVFGNARVFGDAWVSGNAMVSDDAWVSGNAMVSDDARVSGNAEVSGNADVYGNAWVFGDAKGVKYKVGNDKGFPNVGFIKDEEVTWGKERDNVNHPSHYNESGIECIEAIRATLGAEGFEAYCKGNCMKYLWRYEYKNGLEDLKKAQVYLNWMVESMEDRDD